MPWWGSANLQQRKHERFLSGLTIKLSGGEGVVRNVSAGGIYFVTEVALRTGQELKFVLEFPDTPGGPITATCTARVVRREVQGSGYGIGASISSFDFRRLPARKRR